MWTGAKGTLKGPSPSEAWRICYPVKVAVPPPTQGPTPLLTDEK